jgi:hypothetical protein
MSRKESCDSCYYCVLEPPNPQAVGVKQYTCRGGPPQIVCLSPGNLMSVFPPTLPTAWCRIWRPRLERKGNA